MITTELLVVTLLELLIAGGFLLLYPRISRRGLIFGVYVGESASDGLQARAIRRGWDLGVLACVAASIATTYLVYRLGPPPALAAVPLCVLLLGAVLVYLRAYHRAHALAQTVPPPLAAAPLIPPPPALSWLALVTFAVGLAGGLVALAYTWSHYQALPALVPIHFGFSGAPDGWKAKSFTTVMLLPLMTLVMGVGLSGLVYLVTRAKRGLRYPDDGRSLAAQLRFRNAVAVLLAGAAVLVTVLLACISVGSVRVGLGLATKLSPAVPVAGVLLIAWALAGTLTIAVRFGQGGARLEQPARAPLTDGLADNRHWVLGVFYVNRDDPSLLVERRFGLGYTINFGNPRAVALTVLFFGALLGLTLAALLS
jgi:uncharacterized membrane protein